MIIPPAGERHRLDVVALGEVMALHLAEPGVPLAEAARLRRSLAGAEFNLAVGLARLGRRAGWIGRVGRDVAGDAALARLRGEGVDVSSVVVDPQRGTGLLLRDCHPRRTITVEYHRRGSAGSRLRAADVDLRLVERSRVLFASGITPLLSSTARGAQEAALERAAAAGNVIVFDPNLRRKLAGPALARRVLRPIAARADLVLAGLDEGRLLTGRPDREAVASWFHEHGARLVVLKDGAAGSWASDGARHWTQPALPVPVCDPVGAGDAFNAGLLAALLGGAEPAPALREAAAVAALVVGVAGDLEGLPGRAVLDAFLSAASVDR